MKDDFDLYLDAVFGGLAEAEITEAPYDVAPRNYRGFSGPQAPPPSIQAGGPAAIQNWQNQMAAVGGGTRGGGGGRAGGGGGGGRAGGGGRTQSNFAGGAKGPPAADRGVPGAERLPDLKGPPAADRGVPGAERLRDLPERPTMPDGSASSTVAAPAAPPARPTTMPDGSASSTVAAPAAPVPGQAPPPGYTGPTTMRGNVPQSIGSQIGSAAGSAASSLNSFFGGGKSTGSTAQPAPGSGQRFASPGTAPAPATPPPAPPAAAPGATAGQAPPPGYTGPTTMRGNVPQSIGSQLSSFFGGGKSTGSTAQPATGGGQRFARPAPATPAAAPTQQAAPAAAPAPAAPAPNLVPGGAIKAPTGVEESKMTWADFNILHESEYPRKRY